MRNNSDSNMECHHGINICLGCLVRGAEASADEKSPSCSAQLLGPISLLRYGMCNCARLSEVQSALQNK